MGRHAVLLLGLGVRRAEPGGHARVAAERAAELVDEVPWLTEYVEHRRQVEVHVDAVRVLAAGLAGIDRGVVRMESAWAGSSRARRARRHSARPHPAPGRSPERRPAGLSSHGRSRPASSSNSSNANRLRPEISVLPGVPHEVHGSGADLCSRLNPRIIEPAPVAAIGAGQEPGGVDHPSAAVAGRS